MSIPEKNSFNRDISYQVGWKKGRIHVQDPASSPSAEGSPGAETAAATSTGKIKADPPQSQFSAQASDQQGSGAKVMGIIWKSLPYPAERASYLWAVALPIAAFAAVVWLVSKLSQG